MTTLEVCEICDIAECSHIRARRASTGGLSPYWKTYQWAMSGWRAGPIVLAPPPPSFDGILKQFIKPRQSTLRVRKIRWKGKGLIDYDANKLDEHFAKLGALAVHSFVKRLYGVYWLTETTVTWPESKQ